MANSGPYYTLSDLRSWAADGCPLDPVPGLSVFGNPVKHSLSPELHNPALAALNIDMSYIRLLVEDAEFAAVADTIRELGFVGTNVTIPHKFAALEYADVLDPNAARLGAVNTLVFRDGQAHGYNSDGPGFVRTVREAFKREICDLRVLILGAGGGAGRAVAAQCGIEQCQQLFLANRSAEKLAPLAEEMSDYFPSDRLSCVEWEEQSLAKILPEVDLIVNGTNLGMKAEDAPVLPGHLLQSRHLVYDMVYDPALTRLMVDAAAAGCDRVNGLPMLLHQGCVSFEWWFGVTPPVELMRKALFGAAGISLC